MNRSFKAAVAALILAVGGVGPLLFWLFASWVAIGSFVAWIIGYDQRHQPQEGEPCGPGHRWTQHPTNVTDSDLSCEPE
jgi:hypothetical protein